MSNKKKEKKRKKRKALNNRLSPSGRDAKRLGEVHFKFKEKDAGKDVARCNDPPERMMLQPGVDRGFFLGGLDQFAQAKYVGIPAEADGNFVILGGPGSGKSTSIIKPTIETWNGPLFAIDIKGELSYSYLRDRKQWMRDGIIWDPCSLTSLSYDPFEWLMKDSSDNLAANVMDLSISLIPNDPNAMERFWTQACQQVLASALLVGFRRGYSFPQTICWILCQKMSSLCYELKASGEFEALTRIRIRSSSPPWTVECEMNYRFSGMTRSCDIFFVEAEKVPTPFLGRT